MRKLHIDVETYSSVDIMSSGAYKYTESLDFEILILAYRFDNGPIHRVDLAQGEKMTDNFLASLMDSEIIKCAHNANFERLCFNRVGYAVPIDQWECTAVKAAYCGLPLSLGPLSEALELGDKAKLTEGKALIRYFSIPCKPTKANGFRQRNFPHHDPEKWERYINYCAGDVEAETEVDRRLEKYIIPEAEKQIYIVDQEINDRGILIDLVMAANAVSIDEIYSAGLMVEAKKLTGLDNPNSPTQLKGWLSNATKKEITSLAKGDIPDMISDAGPGLVSDVLRLRLRMAKSSIKKYKTMINCALDDGRARGLFQFYGANRTGRWAGRLVQLQNLPRNYIKLLDLARGFVARDEMENIELFYGDVSDTLSQLIRTAFVAPKDKIFAVADYSAIEARVLSWMAGQQWRLDVFNTHGKIYEASAAMMFNLPIESITKGSDLRQKGKVAELALGYQGSVGALTQMGAADMGLTEPEMKTIVTKWREANPEIVKFWYAVDKAAQRAIATGKDVVYKNLIFEYDGLMLKIKLPSNRRLFYYGAKIAEGKFGPCIKYRGTHQQTKQWTYLDTYGGKLTENIVQAISRDLLSEAMVRLSGSGEQIVMHVHDEIVCEIPDDENKEEKLKALCDKMSEKVFWSDGLPLGADGYLTQYYKKD